MTVTLVSQLTSSSLLPGCSLETARVEPVTSNGQYGVPSGIVLNIGVWTAGCNAALLASTSGDGGIQPDTTLACPTENDGYYSTATDGAVCIGVYYDNDSYLAGSYVNTSSGSVSGTWSLKGGTSGSSHCIANVVSEGVTVPSDQLVGYDFEPTGSNYFGSYWSPGGSVCAQF